MDRPKLPFAKIKREVSVEAVAKRYGFRLMPNGDKNWLHGQCRLPSHESKKSNTSFGVNTSGNYWVCHSDSCKANRGGKQGGDVITLVHLLDGCDFYDAAKKLMEDFHIEADHVVSIAAGKKATNPVGPEAVDAVPPKASAATTAANVPLKFQAGFKEIDHNHEYLRKRGIKPETARSFGVGFYGGKSSVIKDPYRIVIPIRNVKGELVAYVGRALDPDAEDKYHFPAGFHKTQELFNLHQVSGNALVLVEGFFSTLKIHQAGFPNVVALMGRTMSEAQERLLDEFEYIMLMLDPDGPGRDATEKLLPRLARHHFVRCIDLPDDKQPDSLSSKEIEEILAPILCE